MVLFARDALFAYLFKFWFNVYGGLVVRIGLGFGLGLVGL